MTPPEKQRPPWGGGRCGTTKTQKHASSLKIAHFPVSQRLRPGILNYRQQRSVADFSRAIRDALDREARLARQTSVSTPPEVLEGISSWVGRGCLP